MINDRFLPSDSVVKNKNVICVENIKETVSENLVNSH